jgi:hypothetical protein
MSSQTKQTLTWGGLLIFFGVMGLAQTVADLNEWAWVALLSLAGLIILGVYLTDRSEWALLIPVYVMWAVAGLIALITLDVLRDEAIATYVLTAIALPFLIVFLRDRSQQWALTPAYVLLAVGIMVGLIGAGVLDDLLIPSYVMFAIAIPFLVVYTRNPKQWWPLIPGGILAMIGASFLVAEAALEYILPVSLIIAGIWIVARQWLRGDATESDSAASEESESALTEQGEVIIEPTPDADATG